MSNDAKKRELSKDQKQAIMKERAQRNRTIRDIFNLFPSQLEVSEMKEVLDAKGVFYDESDTPVSLRKLLTENVNTPVKPKKEVVKEAPQTPAVQVKTVTKVKSKTDDLV